MARRTVGRDLAGSWEFPGGMVEPGEAPAAADFSAYASGVLPEFGSRKWVTSPIARMTKNSMTPMTR